MRSARTEAAVKSVDWRLEGWVSRRRRREIRNELRANLAAAAEQVGPAEAVRRLGSLRALANEYLETERRVVNLRAGTFAALLVFGTVGLFWLVMTQSFRAGFQASVTARPSGSLGPVSYSGDPSLGAYNYTLTMPWYIWLGATAIAFMLGARAWQLLRRR